MKNKILKVVTTVTALCVGVMLSSTDVLATGGTSSGSTAPVAGSVYDNQVSGKKEYCPNASEFTVKFEDDKAIVSDFTIACTDEYDAVMLPGTFIKDGTSYIATYDGTTFRRISERGKGVVVQNGAVVTALEDNLLIDYVRFDSGSKLENYANAFRGWQNLVTVEGFLQAIEPGTNDSIDLGNTFRGCANLKTLTLDFKGGNVSLYNTFTDCNKLQTLNIKNANVSRIEALATRGSDAYSKTTGVCIYPMNITFENIVFPENGTGAYLQGAFNTISGKITFKNCKAGESDLINFDRAFYQSRTINIVPELIAQYNVNCESGGANYNGANIEIAGAKAYSANYMFNESVYGVIKLNGFITEGMTSAVSMFDSADFVSIQGIDSWRFGQARIQQLFKDATTLYDVESKVQQKDYLNEEIIADLQKVNLSAVTHADEMMCFDNEGYIVDYRKLNLSGCDELTPVSARVPFYTPEVPPMYYRLKWPAVYYQTEEDLELCGGYKLTRVVGSGNVIAGADLGHNIIVTGSAAGVRVINSLSGDTNVYNVIPEHELSEYIRDGVDYFTDAECKTPAVLTTVLTDGNNITLYTSDDMIEEDVDSDISFSFDTTTGNINATFDGSGGNVRLIEYDPTLRIRNEQSPQSYTIAGNAKKKAASKFYDIGFTVMHDGEEKQVKSITRNLNITLKLPNDYDGKGVVVLHYKDGLDKSPEVLNSTVNNDDNTVSFYMSTFSHVGVFYNETVVETKELTVKWVDDGNYRNRSGINFKWTAEYDGGLTDNGEFDYTAQAEDTTVIPFEVSKVISGQNLVGVTVTYTLKSQILHVPTWDADTMTLTLKVDDKTEKETKVVKVDMTDVTDDDYRSFVASDRALTVTVRVEYEDGTFEQKDTVKTLASNYKMYELPYELITVKPDGTKYESVQYTLNHPVDYDVNIDYDTDTIVVTKEKDVYGDYSDFTVTGFFKDNSNADGKRPDSTKVKVTAKFGDKEWTTTCTIICRETQYSSYSTHFEIPGSLNGKPRDEIVIEPDPVTDYTVTIAKQESDTAWIDYELEKQEQIDYTKKVTLTFIGDVPEKRPSVVTLQMRDTKGGNNITRQFTVNTAATSTTQDILVPTDDDYVVVSAEGFTDYRIEINGLNITASFTGSIEQPKNYIQNFMLEIKDNKNEDGSRPEKVTLTVSDGKGNEEKFELNVSSGEKFTHQINAADETPWSITKVEGFPERYKITTSANNAQAEYTPEKIKKTVTVKFEGDGDNQDQTRPTSLTIEIKNSDTTVGTVTVDAGTNWTANADVNKYVKGVEAKYTIDCGDVKNYSKTVSDDTITLKFTGTLTQAAQDAVTAKEMQAKDVNALTTEAEEGPDYSIENFDWIDYANKYPDLKRAYGYNKQKLYAHYIRYGIAEGRVATFTGKYNTVNEDILAAYFPDDYKYALIETSADGTTVTETTETNSTTESISENTVSGNSIETAEPSEEGETDDGVVQNPDGTTTEKMTSEDGTVTEITKDADGNIISTKQYKTGDAREVASRSLILFGVLLLLSGAYVGVYSLKDKCPR